MTAEQAIRAAIIAQFLTNRFKKSIAMFRYSQTTKVIYIRAGKTIRVEINQRGKARYV